MTRSPFHPAASFLRIAIVSTLSFAHAARGEEGKAALTIHSIKPASPAKIAAGERLNISIDYRNPEAVPVLIWARPFTNGKSTPGYRAHPSPSYQKTSGTAEGWFYFDRPTVVDEVRVEMKASGSNEAIAKTSLPIKVEWIGEKIAANGNGSDSRVASPTSGGAPASAAAPPVVRMGSLEELGKMGAFGFPQARARVLCDTPQLRFSVYNDDEFFFAQAIFWGDGDGSVGKTGDGRAIGDWSDMALELGTPGEVTGNVDRNYSLNPWPTLAGLRYQVSLRKGAWTGLKDDSKGRGGIRYVSLPDGKKVRVDTYLVPLAEIGKRPGDRFRICYWASSPEPALTLNSVGFTDGGSHYPSFRIPRSLYQEVILAKGEKIDPTQVPEDRKAGGATQTPSTPKSEIAPGAPVDIKFTAVDGREVDLAKLRGKVVLIDFWATWCGPCIGELPHVLDAYRKFHDKGFEIVGISFDQDKAKLEQLTKAKGMTWPQYFDGKGWKNDYGVKYGIHGIPTMWLIDKQGKLATTNARTDLAGQVEKLLGVK
jgi:thiol-disulfide isomerase/thioredoxin